MMASPPTTNTAASTADDVGCDGLYKKFMKVTNKLIHTHGFATALLIVLLPLLCLVSLVVGLQGLIYSRYSLVSGGHHLALRGFIRGSASVDVSRSTHAQQFDIPSCARDVFITLHNNKQHESSCKGMLIRDDIILTTSECSQHTYKLGSKGQLLARPHIKLNTKLQKSNNSKLGFLQTNAPPRSIFINKSVYNTRMFLSLRPTNDDGESVAISCNPDGKAILHNFPSSEGEMIPLTDLYSILPRDTILWEHLDIDTASTLEFKSHKWWTKAISLDEEELYIWQLLKQYEGPPGSISVPSAHEGFTHQAAAFMEVLDPRGHRRGDCFGAYYSLWQHEQPFSGLHFFDWLDYGAGQYVLEDNLLKLHTDPNHLIKVSNHTIRYSMNFTEGSKDIKCRKETFNDKTVHYFNDTERSLHEVYITPSTDGTKLIWRYKHSNELVPPSPIDDSHLYMWDLDKTWYIVDVVNWDHDRYHSIKHTAVLSGKPALAAGKMYFGENGEVTGINFSSGHYHPDIRALSTMYTSFKEMGYNLTATEWIGRTSWSEKDCDDTDWTAIDIPGFDDTVELEQSCQEVTNSPTWRLNEDV